ESKLGVRAAWLAALALARLAGGDLLGLARARDRLLDRLLAHGHSGELDLPGFLRFDRAGDRYRKVRDRLLGLRELAQEWIRRTVNKSDKAQTVEATIAYCDLT